MSKIKRSVCALLSSTLVFTMTTPVLAKEQKTVKNDAVAYVDGTFVYSDHGTYVDMTTGIEYDVLTKQPSAYHECTFYSQYLQSLEQAVVPEETTPVEEETKEEVEADVTPSEEKVDVNKEEKTTVPEEATVEKTEAKEEKAEAKEEKTETTANKVEANLAQADLNYQANTWYHPSDINPQGYVGEIKGAIKKDDFVTGNWDAFKVSSNPFALGQCTYFAWSRFYQVYGYDSGARGNGKTNAAEIVKAHSDKFVLSSTPAAGSVYSIEKNSLYPEYGHVGFVEAYDGEYIWLSDGNVQIGDKTSNIWIHKMSWESFQKSFPDAVFAVPKDASDLIEEKVELMIPEIKSTLNVKIKMKNF